MLCLVLVSLVLSSVARDSVLLLPCWKVRSRKADPIPCVPFTSFSPPLYPPVHRRRPSDVPCDVFLFVAAATAAVPEDDWAIPARWDPKVRDRLAANERKSAPGSCLLVYFCFTAIIPGTSPARLFAALRGPTRWTMWTWPTTKCRGRFRASCGTLPRRTIPTLGPAERTGRRESGMRESVLRERALLEADLSACIPFTCRFQYVVCSLSFEQFRAAVVVWGAPLDCRAAGIDSGPQRHLRVSKM